MPVPGHDGGVTSLPLGVSPSADKGDPTVTTYNVSRDSRFLFSHLVDRGANGCVIGSDMRLIMPHNKRTHLTGIGDHTVRDLDLVCAGGVSRSNRGDIILVFNWGAHFPDGRSIACPGQMEHFGWAVNDKSYPVTKVVPTLTSLEGYVFPLESRDGLLFLQTRPFTDDEWDTLPRIQMTS